MGANGNDQVAGGTGDNWVSLGGGNDSVSLTGDSNTAILGGGNDSVSLTGDNNTAILGNGNDTVTVGGTGNTVTVGSGNDSITAGDNGGSDTFVLSGTVAQLVLNGTDNMVFVNGGTDTITDTVGSTDKLLLQIGSLGGSVAITNFSAAHGVVELASALASGLGWTTPAQIDAAVTSNQHGGSLLSLGTHGSLDFLGVASTALHAANFQIS